MRLHDFGVICLVALWCWLISADLRIVGVRKGINGKGSLVTTTASSQMIEVGSLTKVYKAIMPYSIAIPKASKTDTIDVKSLYYITSFNGEMYGKKPLTSILPSNPEVSEVNVNVGMDTLTYKVVDAYGKSETIYNDYMAVSKTHFALKMNPKCEVSWDTFNSDLNGYYKQCIYIPLMNVLGVIHIKGNIQINMPKEVQEYSVNAIIHAACSNSTSMVIDIMNNFRWTYVNYGLASHLLKQIDVIPQRDYTIMKNDIKCITFQLGINVKEMTMQPPSSNDKPIDPPALVPPAYGEPPTQSDQPKSEDEDEDESGDPLPTQSKETPVKEEPKPKETPKPTPTESKETSKSTSTESKPTPTESKEIPKQTSTEEPKQTPSPTPIKEEPKKVEYPNVGISSNARALCLANKIRRAYRLEPLKGSYALDSAAKVRSRMQSDFGEMHHSVCKRGNNYVQGRDGSGCNELFPFLRTMVKGPAGENIARHSVNGVFRSKGCSYFNYKGTPINNESKSLEYSMEQWCTSQGHLENIVKKGHIYVGFASQSNGESWFATQLFGFKDHDPNKIYEEAC